MSETTTLLSRLLDARRCHDREQTEEAKCDLQAVEGLVEKGEEGEEEKKVHYDKCYRIIWTQPACRGGRVATA